MAEKLVNGTGLGEFASKIKESVPLLGDSSAGTVPLVGADMIADGVITTPKIVDQAVTRGKIDWSTFGQTDEALISWDTRLVTPSIIHSGSGISQKEGWGPSQHDDTNKTLIIDGVSYTNKNTRIHGFWCGSDGVDANGCVVFDEIGIITYSEVSKLQGKVVKRYRHGSFSSGNNGQNWSTVNDHVETTNRKKVGMGSTGHAFTISVTPDGVSYPRGILRVNYVSNGGSEYFCYDVSYNGDPTSMSAFKYALTSGTAATVAQVTNGIKFTPAVSGSAPYGVIMVETLNPDDEPLISITVNNS